MIAAARLSVQMKYLPQSEAKRVEKVIAGAGLPVRIAATLDTKAVMDSLKMDKKKRNNVVHFVLIRKIGMPFVNGGVPLELVRETIEAMQT